MRMRMRMRMLAIAGLFLMIGMVAAAVARAEDELRALARDAIGDDPARAEAAIAALRAKGPEGLAVMMDEHGEWLREAAASPGGRDDRWRGAATAVDKVAAQKDAWASGLYWYTDVEQAKAAARDGGKPILSLRLLGNLDTDLSCANSRFFRTALYANEAVSRALRAGYVLHWKSVRPVPVITIDMGDGRTICRTVTGNSIHYVLDAEGRPVDAIPGLYGPKAFMEQLAHASQLERTLRGVGAAERAAAIAQWHAGWSDRAARQWARDLDAIGLELTEADVLATVARAEAAGQSTAPTALEAAPRAVGKSSVELPIVRMLADHPGALVAHTDDAAWAKIAALEHHADDARLDDGSRRLMAMKFPAARLAGVLAVSKTAVEDPLIRVAAGFERSMAEDTVRNEYTFHRQIHNWFAAGVAETADVEVLNEKVYAELFLTPSSDPWLGLVPADAYAALDGDGTDVATADRR